MHARAARTIWANFARYARDMINDLDMVDVHVVLLPIGTTLGYSRAPRPASASP